MFSYAICVVALIAAVVFVQPIAAETNEGRRTVEEPLCPFVRSAVSQTQLEEQASVRLREGDPLPATDSDLRPPLRSEKSSLAGSSNFRADRVLFESSLADWVFFEDLAREQQAIIRGLLSRCVVTGDRSSLPASVFGQLNVSQRATFVSITHALLNTHLVDRVDGKELGDALQLIEGLLDIQGEDIGMPGDQQFQLIVRLAPSALQKLERAAGFDRGENHVFHKRYPISLRQFRRIGRHGQEAGLHICLAPDGRLAQIHIDYRFGFLHLGRANADVRAHGNHQRHVDRWPEVGFATRLVRVRRAVLLSQNCIRDEKACG